ncbi:MAG: hypothetical protein Q4F72_11160, partial [Desulfovibrionaceae bacterium]|nr:hypothetical protein [Desulfovibrionaceae bacterium]
RAEWGMEVTGQYKGLCSNDTSVEAPYVKAETSFMNFTPRPARAAKPAQTGQQNLFGTYRARENGVSGELTLKPENGQIAVAINGINEARMSECGIEGYCVQHSGRLYCRDQYEDDPNALVELIPVKNGFEVGQYPAGHICGNGAYLAKRYLRVK